MTVADGKGAAMKVTVLGCGTSTGVPLIGCECPICRSDDPRNKRRRVSILVEQGDTVLVVDTAPDFRMQMLDAGVRRLDAVLYTHAHADHVHGIDDLRGLTYAMRRQVPVFGDEITLSLLRRGFGYLFPPENPEDANKGQRRFYPPLIEPHVIEVGGDFRVGDIAVTSFRQIHGTIDSVGYRFGDFAYSTDVNELPPESLRALAGVDVWVVDCLRYRPHPTHAWLERTLEWIDIVKPRRAILTHMNHEIDYATLARDLPDGVEPGYDGLTVTLGADAAR